MNPFFLYSETTQRNQPDELEAVRHAFGEENTGIYLYAIPAGSMVVPRFRAIPFGKELEGELNHNGSVLINTFQQHRMIADFWNWHPALAEAGLTAPAYTADDYLRLPEGEWFVKGETNSIKNRWFDCCYAPTTADLPRVIRNTQNDSYVGSQSIVVRPFRRYRQIGEAVDGRPVFNERRCFILGDQVISTADYWSSLPEYKVEALDETQFQETLVKAVKVTHAMGSAPFRVIDLAEFPDGSWEVVELNDGVMSGLSDNTPETVWSAVADFIKRL
jgi:hypothetical protein